MQIETHPRGKVCQFKIDSFFYWINNRVLNSRCDQIYPLK